MKEYCKETEAVNVFGVESSKIKAGYEPLQQAALLSEQDADQILNAILWIAQSAV